MNSRCYPDPSKQEEACSFVSLWLLEQYAWHEAISFLSSSSSLLPPLPLSLPFSAFSSELPSLPFSFLFSLLTAVDYISYWHFLRHVLFISVELNPKLHRKQIKYAYFLNKSVVYNTIYKPHQPLIAWTYIQIPSRNKAAKTMLPKTWSRIWCTHMSRAKQMVHTRPHSGLSPLIF